MAQNLSVSTRVEQAGEVVSSGCINLPEFQTNNLYRLIAREATPLYPIELLWRLVPDETPFTLYELGGSFEFEVRPQTTLECAQLSCLTLPRVPLVTSCFDDIRITRHSGGSLVKCQPPLRYLPPPLSNLDMETLERYYHYTSLEMPDIQGSALACVLEHCFRASVVSTEVTVWSGVLIAEV